MNRLMSGKSAQAVGAICLALGVLMTGCTMDGSGDQGVNSRTIRRDSKDAEKAGYHEQAAIMSDGKVTKDELMDAYSHSRTCATEGGVEVGGTLVFSPVDGKPTSWGTEMEYDSPEELAAAYNILDDCETQYLNMVQSNYSHSHAPEMTPELVEAVTECLEKQGHKTTGREKWAGDFLGKGKNSSGERMGAVGNCIDAGLADLYPDWPERDFNYFD
jgi:hypothetical protein